MTLNPLDNPDEYNHMELGSVESPGVVTFTGHDSVVNWDEKVGNAQNGSTLTRKGDKAVEFTASFFLADRDDFEDWPAFLAVVNETVKGPKPQPIDCYHPDLAENGIVSVVKSAVLGVQHDGKGGQTRVVKFKAYKVPTPGGGSASGSKTKPAGPVPDPNAAALAQLAALTQQYQETPWG